MRNKIAIALTLFSFLLLYPGVTLPMFTLNLSGAVKSSLSNMNLDILNQSRSILETINELYRTEDYLVSFLILFFSLMVPLLKGVLVILTVTLKNFSNRKKVFNFINFIGKWSMADVFVVAIFLAYLSTASQAIMSNHKANVFGMAINLKTFVSMKSSLGPGFYYFLGYCLLSLVALEFYSFKSFEEKT